MWITLAGHESMDRTWRPRNSKLLICFGPILLVYHIAACLRSKLKWVNQSFYCYRYDLFIQVSSRGCLQTSWLMAQEENKIHAFFSILKRNTNHRHLQDKYTGFSSKKAFQKAWSLWLFRSWLWAGGWWFRWWHWRPALDQGLWLHQWNWWHWGGLWRRKLWVQSGKSGLLAIEH